MNREEALRVEVAGAIARLTQILTSDAEPSTPLRTEGEGSEVMTVWLDARDAQVLTDAGRDAVFVRGRLTSTYWSAGDLYCLTPVEAISLGRALIAAAHGSTVGAVIPTAKAGA